MEFWDMTYGELLHQEILRLSNPKQRTMFLAAYDQMGNHIMEHEGDETLTFGEFFNMYCR